LPRKGSHTVDEKLIMPARKIIIVGKMLGKARRSWDRVATRWIFFSLPNPFSHTMALGSTQPLTERRTRDLPGGVKGGQRIKADNLTAICESIV
jgi:hypothetical protein